MKTSFRYSSCSYSCLAFATAVLFSCLFSFRAAAVEIVAHRGGYLIAPENTCAAFNLCSGLVDRIEFDVRTSADGELAVIHDASVNRTTSGYDALTNEYGVAITNVADLTLAQLKTLDAGVKFSSAFAGERIPTFAEALRALPPGVIGMVHCKDTTPAAVAATLRAENAVSNVVVFFDIWTNLATIHGLEPGLMLGAAGAGELSTNAISLNWLKRCGAYNLLWSKDLITVDTVAWVHTNGMRLYVSPVHTPEIDIFRQLGVDGIVVANSLTAKNWVPEPPSSNAQLARDLVAYWKLDDGLSDSASTNAEDIEVSSPGRLFGFDPAPSWVSGEEARADGALRLDGINDYVRIPTNEALDIGTNTLTISLWVILSALPSAISADYAGIYDSVIDAYVIYLDRNAKELRFKVTTANPKAARPGIPEAQLQTGVWHHVVGVYNGTAGTAIGQAMIFLDGRIVDIHTGDDYSTPGFGLTNIVRRGQAAAIGRNGTDSTSYFAGTVDDVAIWRRALSPVEVRQIYEAGANGVPLERSVMTLWIANVFPDPETGDMQLDLRVEHGSLTNQTLRLRGAILATDNYTNQAVLEGGRGRQAHFRIPASHLTRTNNDPGRRDATRPNFFQVVCP